MKEKLEIIIELLENVVDLDGVFSYMTREELRQGEYTYDFIEKLGTKYNEDLQKRIDDVLKLLKE